MKRSFKGFGRDTCKLIEALGQSATLRRSSGDRPCKVMITGYSPEEMLGRMIDPMSRKVLMSTKNLTDPPDFEKDHLITYVQPYDPDNPVELENLRITAPARASAPNGRVLFWRMDVRK